MYVVPIVLRPVIRGVCIVTIVDLCSTNSIRISIEDDSDDGRYREYFTFSTNTVLAVLCSFPCDLPQSLICYIALISTVFSK